MFKKAVLILGLLALAGCKLHVIALTGGEVQSPTGAGTCLEKSNCFHDIADTSFVESFEAVPAPGYVFVKWYGGEGFQCRNSTDTICTVNSGFLAGLVSDTQIAAANDIYIMPIFQAEGAPITDIVIADGKEWAQVDLFTSLTWTEINEVCPAGVCVESGNLNGWYMTGWTWASAEDMRSLFNSYGVTPPLAPGSDYVRNGPSTWAPAFFADGWRQTYVDGNWPGQGITGTTREQASCGQSCFWLQEAAIYDGAGSSSYDVAKVLSINSFQALPGVGAWFYRTP